MVPRAAIVLSTVALLVGSACWGGGDDSDESPLLRLLGTIPDTEEAGSHIAYSDLDAYYAAIGVDPPPEGTSSEEFSRWTDQVLESDVTSGRFLVVNATEFVRQAFADPVAFREEIGFGAMHIGQSLQAGQPPDTYYILRGDFDHDAIAGTVKSEPNFSDLLEAVSYEGVEYYTWGSEGTINLLRKSPVRRLGGGGRLAVSDELLLWSYWDDGIKGIIDTTKGAQSLADGEDISAMARAVQELGVFVFESYSRDAGDEEPDEEPTILDSYSRITYGSGANSDGPLAALIVTNEDEESANENAERIRTQVEETTDGLGVAWTEHFESWEVSIDGKLTIATFHGPEVSWAIPLGILVPRSES